MNCKRLNVKLKQNICSAIIHTKQFCFKIITKVNESKPLLRTKNSKFINHTHGVCYCIRYKPVGALEWILLRGWWNDKGIWTEDGIFKE